MAHRSCTLLALLASALTLAACPAPPPDAPDAGSCDLPCGDLCCDPNNVCVVDWGCCTLQCEGKQCGDDGCGGACGACSIGNVCDQSSGQCVNGPDGGLPRPDAAAPGRDAATPGLDAANLGYDAGPQPDAGPVGSPVTFTVQDWNLHDFFDENDDPATTDTVYTASQVSSKIAKLAKVINKQAPDILTVQEVETKDLLRRLNDALTKKLPYYELIPARDPRGINVGILSRFPIDEAVTHQNDWLWGADGVKYKYSRDCLEVHLDLGGNRKLVALVNHQISQLEDTNDYKRQAQAQGTRDLADQIRKDSPWNAVLITGDMNDDPTTPTMQVYFNGGQWVDFWTGQSTKVAWTYKQSSTRLYRYDYIIPDVTTATWKQSATLVHDTDTAAASDHATVVAAFRYP